MEERLLFIDNDVFVILAASEMMETTAGILGFDIECLRRLNTLPYMLYGKSFRRTYPESVLNSARDWCDRIASITEAPGNSAAEDRMIAVTDPDNGKHLIDRGEAFMYSLLLHKPACYLASGDKRAMIALATAPELKTLRDAVAGRIVCLEAVLRLLIAENGPMAIARALKPLMPCHKTIQIVFSQPLHCHEALSSYLNELQRKVGGGFLFMP
ncbi:MAG TPA: hypothetical protein VM141_06575 [Planctomycetota bacterium]|nr:hypothetical protein [Planctomycetota bacterium]